MTKQARVRHGARRGQRALMLEVRPPNSARQREMRHDAAKILMGVLQFAFDYEMIHERDVPALAAKTPPAHSRRST